MTTADEIFNCILAQIKTQAPHILTAAKPAPDTMDTLVDKLLADQAKRRD